MILKRISVEIDLKDQNWGPDTLYNFGVWTNQSPVWSVLGSDWSRHQSCKGCLDTSLGLYENLQKNIFKNHSIYQKMTEFKSGQTFHPAYYQVVFDQYYCLHQVRGPWPCPPSRRRWPGTSTTTIRSARGPPGPPTTAPTTTTVHHLQYQMTWRFSPSPSIWGKRTRSIPLHQLWLGLLVLYNTTVAQLGGPFVLQNQAAR